MSSGARVHEDSYKRADSLERQKAETIVIKKAGSQVEELAAFSSLMRLPELKEQSQKNNSLLDEKSIKDHYNMDCAKIACQPESKKYLVCWRGSNQMVYV
jgi:hypothetical protein